jgi:hypothetical protein
MEERTRYPVCQHGNIAAAFDRFLGPTPEDVFGRMPAKPALRKIPQEFAGVMFVLALALVYIGWL